MTRIILGSLKIAILPIVFSFLSLDINAQEPSIGGQWNPASNVEVDVRSYVWMTEKDGETFLGTLKNEDDDSSYDLKDIKLENGKLSFGFGLSEQGESMTIEVQDRLKGDEMSGPWSTISDGNELASGSLNATRQQSDTMKFSGKWNTVATLPDGNELKSTTSFSGDNDNLKGEFESENGKTEASKVTVKGDSLKMEFEIDLEGSSRDVVVEAKATDKNSLEGTWTLLDDAGNEQASGNWSGERVVDYEVLFDGKSLDSFRGYAKKEIGDGWEVVDGTIHFKGKKRSGDIVTKKQYSDFELSFEWKMSAGGNSGVMYRVSLGEKRPWHTGPEYQLLDDAVHKDGKNPSTSTGGIYALYAPKNKTLKPIGEWNSTKIVLNGKRIEHWLNGSKVAEAEVGSDDWNEKFEASKFKKLPKFAKNKKGHICFQDHGNPFWLRNIRIKELHK